MKHQRIVAAALAFAVAVGAASPESSGRDLYRVAGHVVDGRGFPLPRVPVTFRDASGNQLATVVTNGAGEFEVRLPEGAAVLEAEIPGTVVGSRLEFQVVNGMPPVEITIPAASLEQVVVVSATRTDALLTQVGSSVEVIPRQKIVGDGFETLDSALRRSPGLQLNRSGGLGQLTTLFARGGESDYTKILIDGIPVNEPGGSFNLASLSISDIDRIEVVRGPQSALFGPDAIGGVLQVFTHRGSSEGLFPRPRLSVEGGSFNTFRYAAGLEGRSEGLDYSASFARLDTDNDVANGSFNHETASANVGIRTSPNSTLRFLFRNESGRAGVPGPWAFRPPETDEYYRFRNYSAGVKFVCRPRGRWNHTFTYSTNKSHQLSEDPSDSGAWVPEYEGHIAPFASMDFPYRSVNDTLRHNLSWQGDVVAAAGHLVSVGAELERDSGEVGDPQEEPLRARRDNYAAFAQDQWSIGSRVFASAGVRVDNNGSFGWFASPRAALAIQLHAPTSRGFWGPTRAKGSFGLGIKAPTLLESYSESPYYRGNPDLRPERSVSFDAGIEQALGPGGLEMTWFHNRFRDQIGFLTTDPVTYEGSFFNIGRTRARGVETVWHQPLGQRWELRGTWTWLDSKILASASALDPAFAPGRSLFRRPRHSGSAELRWKSGRWTLAATSLMVSSRNDSDFLGLGLTRNPGYTVLNLLASLRLAEGTNLFATVDNVLNRKYMEVLGYPALGARFRIGLRM